MWEQISEQQSIVSHRKFAGAIIVLVGIYSLVNLNPELNVIRGISVYIMNYVKEVRLCLL